MHKHLGKFDLPHVDFDWLEQLPELFKVQGTDVNIPENAFCWMTYTSRLGSIGFTRNTHQHLPELCETTAAWINEKFPELNIPSSRVHILRTIGSIAPHRDESGRLSAINIGLRSAHNAMTRFEDDEVICQDGQAYLLDTSQVHHVMAFNDTPRYLITASISVDYVRVLAGYKGW